MRKPGDQQRSFMTTHWSLVERAGHAPTEYEKQAALSELLEQYRPALMKFLIVNKHVDPDKAEDLVQRFIKTKILEQGLIAKAEKKSGSKFRSFLAVTLWHHCSDYFDSQKNKLDGDRYRQMRERPASLDVGDLEWARLVFERTHLQMKEECRTSGRLHVWRVFESYYIKPTQEQVKPPTYEQLSIQYGFATTGPIASFLADGRKIFERTLRAAVREYSLTDSDIDVEIAELIRISSSVSGGLAQIHGRFEE